MDVVKNQNDSMEQPLIDRIRELERELEEQKRTVQALHEDLDKFHKAFQSSPYMIVITRLSDGKLLDVNDTFLRQTGYSREEALSSSSILMNLWVNIEDRNQVVNDLQNGIDVTAREFTLRDKYGSTIIGSLSSRMVNVWGEKCVVSSIEDVTEQRQAEKELLDSRNRLSLFFNQSIYGYYFSKMDEPLDWVHTENKDEVIKTIAFRQVITEINEAMCLQYGTTCEKMQGRKLSEFFKHNENAGLENRRKLFDQGYLHSVTNELKDDGTPVWIEGDYRCVYDDQGRIMGTFGVQIDITNRVLADQEKSAIMKREKQAHEELNTFLNRISDGLVAFDSEMNYVFVNEAGARLLGRKPEELIGKNYWTEFPEASKTPFANNYVRALQEQVSISFEEYYAPWKRWFANTIYPSGNGISIFFQEITERKKNEIILKEERLRLEGIIKGTNAGTWEWNVQSGEVIFNERWAGIIGYNLKDLEPLSIEVWQRFAHPDDLKKSNELLQRHFAGELDYYECEARMKHKNGSWVWILDRGKILSRTPDGNPLIIMGTHQDITERKLAEEALKESESRYKNLLANLNVGIVVHAPNTKITYYNNKALEIMGLTEDQVLGRSALDPEWGFIDEHENVLPLELYPAIKVSQDKKPIKNQIVGVRKPEDGQMKWATVNGLPVFHPDNPELLTEIIISFIDITDLKTTESALKESEGRVRARLDAVMSPEGDLGMLELADIIDVKAIQNIMDDFYQLTRIGVAIIDLEGKVLVATGWQEVCVRYHRMHPETRQNCIESDSVLSSGIEPGKFKVYKCKNHMWDMATPIVVGGRHVGNLFLGQFFFDDEIPDFDDFKDQAKKYGFDEEEYIKALNEIPRWSRQTTERVMSFYTRFAELVSLLSYGNLKLARSLEEQKRTEQALRYSEELHRKLLTTVPDLIVRTDLQGNVVFVNEFGLRNFPFLTPTDLLGRNMLNFIAEEDMEKALTNTRLMFNGPLGVKEYRFTIKGHENLICEVNGDVLYDSDNQPVGMVYLIRDITERKKTEEKIRESEERFRLLVKNSSDSICTINPDGIITYISPAIERITGFAPDYFLGKPYPLIVHPDDQPELSVIWNKAVSNPEKLLTVQYRVVHKTRQWVYLEALGQNLFHIPAIESLVVSIRDITEVRQSHLMAQIQINVARSVLSAESLHELIVIVKAELGKIMDTSHFSFALYLAETDTLKYFGLTGDPDSFREMPAGSTIPGEVVKSGKTTVLKGDEIETFASQHHLALPGNLLKFWIGIPVLVQGRPVAIMVLEVNTESFGFSASDQALLEMIAHETGIFMDRKKILEDLLDAKEKAVESDRLKTAFLANMSHEIRTPMNGILGFANLLKEPGLSGEEQQKFVGIIEKSGERMLKIINDLIDISKIEAGQMDIAISETNINEQIEFLFNFFQPEAEKKGLQFHFFKGLISSKATILTDREKLYAILTNLIKNALKYTPSGTIEFGYYLETPSHLFNRFSSLTSTAISAIHSPDSSLSGRELLFYVKDTGIGIPKDRQQAIFERFIQADIEDRKAFQGAGLGLAITRAYVEMLGGKIWVESEEGKGSAFYFTLGYQVPKNKGLENGAIKEEKVELPAAKKLKILIAEDDTASTLFLTTSLKSIATEFISVRYGDEAVRTFTGHPDIDLVLMDIRMPGMDGHEAARLIREFNTKVIIIAQTAHGLAGDREKALKAGCNDYIAKPIRREELLGIIKRYFS